MIDKIKRIEPEDFLALLLIVLILLIPIGMIWEFKIREGELKLEERKVELIERAVENGVNINLEVLND